MCIFQIDLKKFKVVSVLTVGLTLLVIAVGSLSTFEAKASESLVVNQGPCLIFKDKLNSPDRVTDLNFNVDLGTCVKIIGSLSNIYQANNSGYAYGLHQGSAWESHIAIRASASDPDDHRAWVKRTDEREWGKWAENWWDSVVTIQ